MTAVIAVLIFTSIALVSVVGLVGMIADLDAMPPFDDIEAER